MRIISKGGLTLLSYSAKTWSPFVEGGEGSYLSNSQTNLVIALYTLFCKFINTTAYHLGRYEPSPPSTKELHGQDIEKYKMFVPQ